MAKTHRTVKVWESDAQALKEASEQSGVLMTRLFHVALAHYLESPEWAELLKQTGRRDA